MMPGRLLRSWRARVAVEGESMAPTLISGDWLLADPDAYRNHSAAPGDLVLVPDPRQPSRLLVKRVADVQADGKLYVRGDAPERSTDSRTFGALEATSVEGRPWFRYWPLRRWGRIE
jgi:nickel-type superoxide dismutase maturation protease